MKTIFAMLLCTVGFGTSASAQIVVAGPITNNGGAFPAVTANQVQGASQIVADMTALSNTPSWLRATGQLFYVTGTAENWRLIGGTNNDSLTLEVSSTNSSSSTNLSNLTVTNRADFSNSVSIAGTASGVLAVGGDSYSHVALAVGIGDHHPMVDEHQVGVYSALHYQSNALMAGDEFSAQFESAPGTQPGNYTIPRSQSYAVGATSKGAGTSITRTWGLGTYDETAGDYNAAIAPGDATFTNDWFIYYPAARPSRLGGALTVGGTLVASNTTQNVHIAGSSSSGYAQLYLANDLGVAKALSLVEYGSSFAGTSSFGVPYAGLVRVNSAANYPFSIGASEAQPILFYNNGAETMRIASGGNVGVGTTNPAGKLTVSGDLRTSDLGWFTNGMTTASGGLTNLSTAPLQSVGPAYVTGTASGGLAVGGDLYSHVLLAAGYNSNPLRDVHQIGIYSALKWASNNVGADTLIGGFETAIGTEAGSYTVSNAVNYSVGAISKGAGSTILRTINYSLYDQTSGDYNATFAPYGSMFTNDWFLYYTGSRPSLFGGSLSVTGSVVAATSGAQDSKILSAGSGSYSRLWVANNLGISKGLYLLQYGSTFAGYNSLGLSYTNLTTIASAANAPLVIGNVEAQPLVFFNNNLETMRIQSGGNVGIGTTNPAAKLEVVGKVSAGVTNSTTPAFRSAGTNALVLQDTVSGTFLLTCSNGVLVVVTNTSGL